MRNRRIRRWQRPDEDDPLTGLVNLFDLWMVFSIALLIVLVGGPRRRAAHAGAPTPNPAVLPTREPEVIEQYRLSREELNASGERLGVAYRLPSGEVVCVPDAGPTRPRSAR